MLARWQFERAELRRELLAEFAARESAPPLDLSAGLQINAADFAYRRAFAVGRFAPEDGILIDNRVYQGRAGYLVMTPFALGDSGGTMLMVDRGWIAANASRANIPPVPPPPQGVVTVRGVLLPDDEGALELSSDIVAGRVWQNLHLKKYAAITGHKKMLPLFLRVADSALPPLPARPQINPARNTAYAWQWLGLAAVAAVFAAMLFVRKSV